VSLARFFDRAADASLPVLAGLGRTAFRERLASITVALAIDAARAQDPAPRAAYLLAANLAARLYPRLILSAPVDLRTEASELASAINPAIDLRNRGEADVRWRWSTRAASGTDVHVSASSWNVAVDGAQTGAAPPEIPAALAATAIGLGDVFRTVFATDLGVRGRHGPEGRAFNLLTGGARVDGLPTLREHPELGRVYLAGAGAVGEAAALTFREAGAAGVLVAVDPQRVDVGNLQRYLLAVDSDERAKKATLLKERLASSRVAVEAIDTLWGADARTQMPIDTLLAALDTTGGRIELQAGLPRRLFNAYTQPLDVGWSRHEEFGVTGCLVCLYWPTGLRPHRFETLAEALQQDPQRVLRYLANPGLTVDRPIAVSDLPANIDPEMARRWTVIPIARDIGDALFGDSDALADRGRVSIDDLYYEMCAGTLIPSRVGERQRDVLVPLAHQSALAGIMLASQVLVANQSDLSSFRPPEQQMRFDVFRPAGPRSVAVGRVPGCICNDRFYLEAYRARWQPGKQRKRAST
jgi:hypothetical protein